MATCPNCQNQIQDDFGLVTCKNCGAQVLLSIDGSSEIASENPSDNLQNVLISEAQNDSEAQTAAPAEVVEPMVSPPSPAPHERPLPTTPDMSEVADFGNSPASLAREGSLRFNLFLSGIDTAEIREEVKEALSDERFLWDTEALMAKARGGELKVSDLSAVKTSLIIQRLRSVSIDIRWEQYAIHQ
jgi:hypothetical protein